MVVQLQLLWKSNEYYMTWVCVGICTLRYAACNAHEPYCHLWTSPLWNIVHTLTNSTILEKKLPNTKCVFGFSLQLLSKIYFILRKNVWNMIQILVFTYSSLYSYPILINLNFSIDFGKILNIKFHENPSSGSQVPCTQTKGQTWWS